LRIPAGKKCPPHHAANWHLKAAENGTLLRSAKCNRGSYRALVGHLVRVIRDEDQPLARPGL
jgi:hypothetical protein